MPNKIFTSLLEEQINKFRYSFSNISNELFYDDKEKKLIHAGEFGTYRESICKEFLRFLIPRRLEIEKGFLINRNDEVSTQCDIVIFDSNNTPLIKGNELQRFFPVETVVSIGEIKSNMSKSEFKAAINKLALNKMMRYRLDNPSIIKRDLVGSYDPDNVGHDLMFSFIICNKLEFDIKDLINEIDKLYNSEIKDIFKHNMILSIHDGLLFYVDKNRMSFHYPNVRGERNKNRFVYPGTEPNSHIFGFSHYFFMGTSSATIFYPEIRNYIAKFGGGFNIDENPSSL